MDHGFKLPSISAMNNGNHDTGMTGVTNYRSTGAFHNRAQSVLMNTGKKTMDLDLNKSRN
jgi:hypothetical protein